MKTLTEGINTMVERLSDYLGVPVILSDQTAPELPFPYMFYSVTAPYITDGGSGNYGYNLAENEMVEVVREEQPSATFSFTACSMNRYGEKDEYIFGEDEARELAQRAHGWFLHVGTRTMQRLGFVVVEVMNTGDRTVLVVDEAARRYGFDVRLRYTRIDVVEIEAVRKVTVKKE